MIGYRIYSAPLASCTVDASAQISVHYSSHGESTSGFKLGSMRFVQALALSSLASIGAASGEFAA